MFFALSLPASLLLPLTPRGAAACGPADPRGSISDYMNTHSLPPPDSDVLIITVKGGGGGCGATAARRHRGRMLDLVPAGANFCPLQFPKFQKRCRNGGGARGACDRVRTCEEGNQGVDGTGGVDRGEGGGVVRSFVTSLWRFNVKVDRRATETSDFFPTKRDQNSPSSSSSRARRPPDCFCAIVLGNPMRHFRRRRG